MEGEYSFSNLRCWPWTTKRDGIEVFRWINVVENLLSKNKLSEFFNTRNQVGSSFIKNIKGYIEGVSFSPKDKDILASVGIDRNIIGWDIRSSDKQTF